MAEEIYFSPYYTDSRLQRFDYHRSGYIAVSEIWHMNYRIIVKANSMVTDFCNVLQERTEKLTNTIGEEMKVKGSLV